MTQRILHALWQQSALLLLVMVIATRTVDALGFASGSNESPGRIGMHHMRQESEIRLFYIVNKTEVEIKIRVCVDGKELFVRRMEAHPSDSSGVVHPSQNQYPTLALKVPVKKGAQSLMIQESLFLKKRKMISISDGSPKGGAGFQITISKDGIAVTQDYHPSY